MSANRLIEIRKRTAKVTNLNAKPERHGDENEKRVDLSLAIVVNDHELDPIVRTRWEDASKVLWDEKGEPQFLDIDEFALDRSIEGEVTLGLHNAKKTRVVPATMKKLRLRPMLGREAELAFQVRFDPSGFADELLDMQADEQCQFAFVAADKPKAETEQQQQLV